MTIYTHANITRYIRPYYNKTYSNDTLYTTSPRPLKQYRQGRIQNSYQETKNSVTQTTLLKAMDAPGQMSTTDLGNRQCQGVPLTQEIFTSLNMKDCYTNNQQASKALKLLRNKPVISKSYSQNYYQYLQKRCNTITQKSFNFAVESDRVDKPGSPIALYNTYVGNCINCSTPTCNNNKVVYKPSNYKFANEGAVSSDLRTYSLGAQTIETDAYLQRFCLKL